MVITATILLVVITAALTAAEFISVALLAVVVITVTITPVVIIIIPARSIGVGVALFQQEKERAALQDCDAFTLFLGRTLSHKAYSQNWRDLTGAEQVSCLTD